MSSLKSIAAAGFLLFLAVGVCAAQTDSLGDVARQQRLKKNNTAAPAHHVVTNEDDAAPARADSSSADSQKDQKDKSADSEYSAAENPQQSKDQRATALQGKIRNQKQRIRQEEDNIKELQAEMEKWKGLNCGYTRHIEEPSKNGCDIPARLTLDRDRTSKQLERDRASLLDMQEEVRKMGYGNSFYDPD